MQFPSLLIVGTLATVVYVGTILLCRWHYKNKYSRFAANNLGPNLQPIINTMPQFMWIVDNNGLIDYANKSWCEFTGFVSIPDKKSPLRDFAQPLNISDPWTVASATSLGYKTDMKIRSKDGNEQTFTAHIHPIKDLAGRITNWVGICSNTDVQKVSNGQAEKDVNSLYHLRLLTAEICKEFKETPLKENRKKPIKKVIKTR
jgi:PAS domain S-box-containing protein